MASRALFRGSVFAALVGAVSPLTALADDRPVSPPRIAPAGGAPEPAPDPIDPNGESCDVLHAIRMDIEAAAEAFNLQLEQKLGPEAVAARIEWRAESSYLREDLFLAFESAVRRAGHLDLGTTSECYRGLTISWGWVERGAGLAMRSGDEPEALRRAVALNQAGALMGESAKQSTVLSASWSHLSSPVVLARIGMENRTLTPNGARQLRALLQESLAQALWSCSEALSTFPEQWFARKAELAGSDADAPAWPPGVLDKFHVYVRASHEMWSDPDAAASMITNAAQCPPEAREPLLAIAAAHREFTAWRDDITQLCDALTAYEQAPRRVAR